jgi:hypothetical protein
MATDPQELRDMQTVVLLRYLFTKMCKDERIPTEKRGLIVPAYFFGWIDRTMNLLNFLNVGDECAAAKVSVEIWDFVREVLGTGLAVERFGPLWYSICLSTRPALRHRLQKIMLNCVLTWEDGRISPIQIYIDRAMMEEGKDFSDGLVADLINTRIRAIVHIVAERGLDQLHQESDDYRGMTPEDPFEVMMGMLLKIFDKRSAHLASIPCVRDDLQDPVMKYVRLAQGIIRPVIPPKVQAQLNERKHQWQQDQEGKSRPKIVGGFE